MSSRILRKRRDPLEYLEKLINRSSLTTQRVTHTNIITVGGHVLTDVNDDRHSATAAAINKAITETEARAARELRAALQRLTGQLTEAKEKALQTQRDHFEKVAKRVAEHRDRQEAEKLREQRKQCEAEKEEALRLQWEGAEKQKQEAVQLACQELTKRLKNEFALEKERAIGKALMLAREGFKRRLEEAISDTKRECERLAAEETKRVAQLHAEEIQRHEGRYKLLKVKYKDEHTHRLRVESDFAELQTDYQRFMNYTDGKYHSDYMMRLRRHGMCLADKRPSDVSEYSEKDLRDIAIKLSQTTT